ncbi:hypothetical protein AaE_008994 [Aphanomyces astaci]|uniref:Uncharacterized protein n=1 Tax=Aphanomyces astaci TaxID=112090 RepID=A0A6A5A655_APHAT|nr:hypothetical protein AaE_008994 [Aphanomyces astaci]
MQVTATELPRSVGRRVSALGRRTSSGVLSVVGVSLGGHAALFGFRLDEDKVHLHSVAVDLPLVHVQLRCLSLVALVEANVRSSLDHVRIFLQCYLGDTAKFAENLLQMLRVDVATPPLNDATP